MKLRYELTQRWLGPYTALGVPLRYTNKHEALRVMRRFENVALIGGQHLVHIETKEVVRSYGMDTDTPTSRDG